MHIAYCTAVYPCRSETFLHREVSSMQAQGASVSVWALSNSSEPGKTADAFYHSPFVTYRPRRLSMDAWQSLGWLIVRHPLRMLVLVWECTCIATYSPGLALSFIANLQAIAFFARQAERCGITLIHGYFLNLPGLIAMGASIATGIPFTVAGHARDVFAEGEGVSRLARRARYIIVCHASAAAALMQRIPHDYHARIQVVNHGLDSENWALPDTRCSDGCTKTIVAVGRVVPKKGYECLIRACELLREQGEEFRLVMVGEGPQADVLRRQAELIGVDGCITWTGWLSAQAVRKLLSEAAITVVPSIIATDGDRDGIPNVVLESWAMGVPVIASSLPSLSEAIVHEVHGLLVEPNNVVDLAEAIRRVLGDPALRTHLALHGRQRVQDQYDLRTNVTKLMTLFEKAHHDGAAT